MKKADIARLKKLLEKWNIDEITLQERYGPPQKRSMRASKIKDAESLRRVLEEVQQ